MNDNKIKTTDWLVKGISQKQLDKEKIQALKREIKYLEADNKRIAKEYMIIQNHYLHDTVAQYAENKGYLKALDDLDRLSFIVINNDKGKEYLEGFIDAIEIVDGFIKDLKASKVQTIKGGTQ